MDNLGSNSTIDGSKIVTEDNKSNHIHSVLDVKDFGTVAGKDLGKGGGIYAERIDNKTVEDLRESWVTFTKPEMQGTLKVTNFDNDDALISKEFLDQYADNVLVEPGTPITDTTKKSIYPESNSLIVTNYNGRIDRGWFDVNNISNEFYAMVDGPLEVVSNNQYQYTITNYDSFSSYQVSIDQGGTVSISNDTITLDTNTTNSTEIIITMTVTVDSYSHNYEITFLAD